MASRVNDLESDEHDVEDFYFESEHLALKNNQDYQVLMKTIAILQAQRAQSLKDIDTLANMRVEALENPENFVEKLVRGENLGFPQRLEVATVPKIDFSKYDIQPPELSSQGGNPVNAEDEEDSRLTSKSGSSIRLWTVEEQKRLEELLIEYPPEPIERRRFEKIARALGNRTSQQVASRCQKYFKKLQMAGLPIPGRHPKGRLSNVKMRCFSGRKSTFFPDLDVPVRMNEEEDELWLQPSTSRSPQEDDSWSREEEKYTAVDDTDDEEAGNANEMMLKRARRIRAEKERDLEDRPASLHLGFKCDICQEEPIRGTRWHCKVCQKSTDYCTDCIFTQLLRPDLQHPLDHKFAALRVNPNSS